MELFPTELPKPQLKVFRQSAELFYTGGCFAPLPSAEQREILDSDLQ